MADHSGCAQAAFWCKKTLYGEKCSSCSTVNSETLKVFLMSFMWRNLVCVMRDALLLSSLEDFCCQLLVLHIVSCAGFLGLIQAGTFIYRSLLRLDCGAVLRRERFLVVAKFEIIFLLIISG